MRITMTRVGVAMTIVVCQSAIVVAQKSIPIRQLTTIEASSSEPIGFISGVRELSDGRVLINDAGARRILIFDKTLASAAIVADTSPGRKLQYGSRASGIIPFAGDSTLFVDIGGRAFIVLDGAGNVARVMSAPRPNDMQNIAGGSIGTASLDKAGRLLYRSMLFPLFKAPIAGKPYTPPTMPDSAPLLRADFDTRIADTIAWLRVPTIKINSTFLANGGVRLTPVFSPISTIDDWTALPDGSVAVLRGSDYHIEWIGTDGTRSSTPKMPFDWKRLSDEDKASIIDSTKKALERQSRRDATPSAPGSGGGGMGGHGGPSIPAGHSMTIMPVGSADGAPPPQSANKGPSLPAIAEVVSPNDLPDYYPPILQSGEMRADFAGNIWILPSTTTQLGRGLLYDVVNRNGELVERVRLPEGRALEGFGRDGAVYLTSHGPNGTRLERARRN
jgi:hypothetical protein